MESIIIPAVLIAGLVGGAFLTRWFNWIAWGKNRRKKEMTEKRMAERAINREKKDKQ